MTEEEGNSWRRFQMSADTDGSDWYDVIMTRLNGPDGVVVLYIVMLTKTQFKPSKTNDGGQVFVRISLKEHSGILRTL